MTRDDFIVSLRDARFRETFRMGPTAHPPADTASRADELVAALLAEMQSRGFERAEERFALARPAVSPAFPGTAHRLTPDAAVVRDPLVVAVLRTRDGDVELSFQGKGLPFPVEVADTLAFIVSTDRPFRAAALPGGLDLANRLHLLAHLIDEGLLRLAHDEERDPHAR